METASVNLDGRYYKFSGKFNVRRTILFTILLSLVVAVFSVIYSCVLKWIPFVYLNFIITGVMYFVLYFAQEALVKAGRIRNGAVNLIVGIILFLVFVHWHFIGYAAIHLHETLYNETFFETVSMYLISPGQLVQDVLALNGFGTWSMFGLTFKGVILTVVWVIEHIVVLAGALLCFATRNDKIYIESGKCWAEEVVFDDVIRPLDESVKKSFEEGNFRAIEDNYLTDKNSAHCVISYFTDKEKQSGEYYLKVRNIAEDETNKNTLIMGLKIKKRDLDHIQMSIDRLRVQRDEAFNKLLKNLPDEILNEVLIDLLHKLLDETYDGLSYDDQEELKDELRQKLLDYLPDDMPNELQDNLLSQLLDELLSNRMGDMLNNLLNDSSDDMQDKLLRKLSIELEDSQWDDLRSKLQSYLSDDMLDELKVRLLEEPFEYSLKDMLEDLLEKLPKDVLDGLVNRLPESRWKDISDELEAKLVSELEHDLQAYLPGDLPDDTLEELLEELLYELYKLRDGGPLNDLLEKLPKDVLDRWVDRLQDDRWEEDIADGLTAKRVSELEHDLQAYLPDDLPADMLEDLLEDLLYELYDRRDGTDK